MSMPKDYRLQIWGQGSGRVYGILLKDGVRILQKEYYAHAHDTLREDLENFEQGVLPDYSDPADPPSDLHYITDKGLRRSYLNWDNGLVGRPGSIKREMSVRIRRLGWLY